jgi:hypothetical protein
VQFTKDANQLLRDAMNANVFSPTPSSIQRFQCGNASLLQPLMNTVAQQWEQNLNPSPWLYKQSSWQLPTTRRYLQSRQAPSTPLVQPDATLDWLVELARFPVSYGSVGIIKSFEQYVSQEGTTWTENSHWGNPYPSGVSVRWFLRLSPLSKVASPWVNVTGASAIPDYLPGMTYDDFSESRGIWFPAGSPAASNIHLIIPGDRVLRILAIVTATVQTPVTISAKLSGTTQTEMSSDAQTVVRQSW